jgi:hypothetical protein
MCWGHGKQFRPNNNVLGGVTKGDVEQNMHARSVDSNWNCGRASLGSDDGL